MTTALLAAQVGAARMQMGFTLGYHIVLACLGIAFPAVVLGVHYLGLRRGDQAALLLARRWSKVLAVLVAVGAVTGTVLSFEMGLLWPGLMGRFGGAIGVPFSFEGIFFLLEAIFTAIYLHGWGRLSPWAHWWSGTPTVVAGLGGALSVVAANSWMNAPTGFTLSNGVITDIDPVAVFFNPATYYEVPHMVLAAYMVTGFGVASVYAVGLLRGRRDRYHRVGFLLPFTVGAVATPLQIFIGDVAARAISTQQPIKFAVMEYVPHTDRYVTEWIFGSYSNGQVRYGLGIPYLDSLLVGFSPAHEVIGWDTVPPADRPPLVTLIHTCFDLMVLAALALLVLSLWLAWTWWRRRDLPRHWTFLGCAALSGFAAVVALECGWIVTEVGRQPWVVYGVMRTADAATTATGVDATLLALEVLYGVLFVATIGVLRGLTVRWRRTGEVPEQQLPYGPSPHLAPEQPGVAP